MSAAGGSIRTWALRRGRTLANLALTAPLPLIYPDSGYSCGAISTAMRPLRSKGEAVPPPEPDGWGDLAWSSRCGQRLVLCERLLYTAET